MVSIHQILWYNHVSQEWQNIIHFDVLEKITQTIHIRNIGFWRERFIFILSTGLTIQGVWNVKHSGYCSRLSIKEWVTLVWPMRNQDITVILHTAWIFGSFLMTPGALLSCHIYLSKQEDDGTLGHSGRTGVEPEGDHVMRITRSDLDRVQRIAVERGTCSLSEASLTSLQGGASVGTSWLLEENTGRGSPLSEYMSFNSYITHHRNINPFENKVWEIYIFKEVCLFVHWSS